MLACRLLQLAREEATVGSSAMRLALGCLDKAAWQRLALVSAVWPSGWPVCSLVAVAAMKSNENK